MKRILPFLLLFAFASTPLFAQSFNDSIKAALEQMDNAQTADELQATAKQFEKLAQKHPDEWLPSYYAALSYVTACHMTREFDDKNALLDKARKNVQQVQAIAPQQAEAYVMQAYVYLSRMQSTLSDAGKYRPLFEAAIEKALALDAENPRAYFLKGQHTYYASAGKSDGFQAACPLFKKSVELYQAEAGTPQKGIAPTWGFKYAERYAARCK